MKPLVIYHDNCADGFGAAFAAWLKLGDEAEYVAAQYGDDAPVATEVIDREIYILDFSFPRVIMDNLFRVAEKVVWLDHHKTAFEMWCGGIPESGSWQEHPGRSTIPHNKYITLDNNRSGALIAWEYFHPEKEIPMMIKHIDDYDRWQFKLEGCSLRSNGDYDVSAIAKASGGGGHKNAAGFETSIEQLLRWIG